ncbi:hypothetical protein ACP4OV_010551 [Aristida adscensionis]
MAAAAAAAAVHGGGGGGGCGRRRGAVDEGARVGRPRRGHRGAPSRGAVAAGIRGGRAPLAAGEGELRWPQGRASPVGHGGTWKRRGRAAPSARASRVASRSSLRSMTNEEAAVKETLRYSMFLGAFAGSEPRAPRPQRHFLT